MIQISKYEELASYLAKQDEEMLRMSFDEVARIVGSLPQGAYDYRAWWANSQSNNHAVNGWMRAGWETSQVDMDQQELVFVRTQEVVQDALLPGYLPQTRRRKSYPRRDQISTEVDMILKRTGGVVTLSRMIDAVERYIRGEIQEMELGQELRRLWHQKR